MASSRPLQQVADDPSTDESVRERLRQLPLMIEFAVVGLGLHKPAAIACMPMSGATHWCGAWWRHRSIRCSHGNGVIR